MSATAALLWGGFSSASEYVGEAVAAGAVLTMLANSLMPEAFEHRGPSVGLLTVAGFLVAAVLAVAT